MTTVVNIKTDEYDVYCGRAGNGESGYFGNPFRTYPGDKRENSIAKFNEYFLKRVEGDWKFKEEVLKLKGKRLGCFCKPKPCHVDIIAEWINKNA